MVEVKFVYGFRIKMKRQRYVAKSCRQVDIKKEVYRLISLSSTSDIICSTGMAEKKKCVLAFNAKVCVSILTLLACFTVHTYSFSYLASFLYVNIFPHTLFICIKTSYFTLFC